MSAIMITAELLRALKMDGEPQIMPRIFRSVYGRKPGDTLDSTYDLFSSNNKVNKRYQNDIWPSSHARVINQMVIRTNAAFAGITTSSGSQVQEYFRKNTHIRFYQDTTELFSYCLYDYGTSLLHTEGSTDVHSGNLFLVHDLPAHIYIEANANVRCELHIPPSLTLDNPSSNVPYLPDYFTAAGDNGKGYTVADVNLFGALVIPQPASM